jgi:hypothetical protein
VKKKTVETTHTRLYILNFYLGRWDGKRGTECSTRNTPANTALKRLDISRKLDATYVNF